MYIGIDVGTSRASRCSSSTRASTSRARRALPSPSSAPTRSGPSRAPPAGGTPRGRPSPGSGPRRPRASCRRPRHRPLRSDARRHFARRGSPRAPPRHPMERRPQPRRVRRARTHRAGDACDHRQRCHAGLHRTQAALGRPPRARTSSPGPRTSCSRKTGCAFELTGELATDPSDAAGTLWLDVAGRR